jgi:hypothetical protein
LANDQLAKKKAEEIARKKAQREAAKKIAKTVGKTVARRIFRIVDLAFPEPVGGDLRYEDLIIRAQRDYPDKAGKIENHHIIPKYLGGDPYGETVPIDAAYHQAITNAFRQQWPYKGDPDYRGGLRELQKILNDVYSRYPLPGIHPLPK